MIEKYSYKGKNNTDCNANKCVTKIVRAQNHPRICYYKREDNAKNSAQNLSAFQF